jgi:hypothetical protein
VKYNELIRILKSHNKKTNRVICPDHGSKEIGKGLEIRIKKDAGLL